MMRRVRPDMLADHLLRVAAQQRKLANLMPDDTNRFHFLESAERIETLARASSELHPPA